MTEGRDYEEASDMVWNNDSTYLFHIHSGKQAGNTGIFNQPADYPANINRSTVTGNARDVHKLSHENWLPGR